MSSIEAWYIQIDLVQASTSNQILEDRRIVQE